MKTTLIFFAGLSASFAIYAAEPSPPPCQFIKPEKLVVHEDGTRKLAATSVTLHGEWSLQDGVICGVHGHEKHLATLKFDQPFEDCVLTFRVRFVDAGSFVFVAGAHGLDVAFSAASPAVPAPIKIKGRKPETGPESKPQVLTTQDKAFKVGEWIDVLIEYSGDQMRARIGDTEMKATGHFRNVGRKNKVFYLNGGNKPGTRVEFDDILCWSGKRIP